jgi:UDP-3-O-[3-hydroxymyristoyl] glucosamine N-acyltransferase
MFRPVPWLPRAWPAGAYTGIFPLAAHHEWLHNAAQIKRLAKLAERVAELEKNSN